VTRRNARVLDSQGHFINRICFSPDGRWIAGGGGLYGEPACVALWKRSSTSAPARVAELQKETVCALAFSPDSTRLTSSCWPDSVLELWQVPSLKQTGALPLIPAGSRPLAGGLKRTDTGCWDLRPKIWNLKRGSPRELEPAHRDNVDFIAFLDEGRTLLSGTADALWLWDVRKAKPVKKIQIRSPEHVWKHALAPDRRRLLSVGSRGTVRVWDTHTWKFEAFPLNTKVHIRVFAVSPDSRSAAIGFDNGQIIFWSIAGRGKPVRWKLDHCIASLAYSPDGEELGCVQLTQDGKSLVQVYSVAAA
jgi:WD40 repeat protein